MTIFIKDLTFVAQMRKRLCAESRLISMISRFLEMTAGTDKQKLKKTRGLEIIWIMP